MEENKPLVSIIVRTKDRPKLLKKALQSIAAQTYRPTEVVLVNDGGCELDIEELKTILSEVSLNHIRLEKNTGRAHAGNIALENTKGEYVGFLDDDDEFYPEHISLLVGYLQQSDLKIAYTDSLMVYKEYDPRTQILSDVRREVMFSADFDYGKLLFDNYIPFMCLLFDRKVLVNEGGLDEDFELYEDYDLLIRLGEKYPFYHIRKVTSEYNQWSNASQISQRSNDAHFLRGAYLRLFSKHLNKFTPERIYDYRATICTLKDSHIENLEAVLRGKEAHIENLEAVLRGKEAHIENLDAMLKAKNHYLENFEVLLRDKEVYIEDLVDVIRGKDQYISAVASQLRRKDERIADLEAGIHVKEQRIVSLESLYREKDRVLSEIYSSNGWKLLMRYYKIRDKLLPSGYFRRRFFKGIFLTVVSFPKFLKKKRPNQLI